MSATGNDNGRRPPVSAPAPAAARASTEHRLKCWPDSFAAVLSGRKRFEIRKDDRGFASGDVVILCEFDPLDVDGTFTGAPRGFTGKRAMYFIGWMERSICLPPGWCGFELISMEDLNRAMCVISAQRQGTA